MSAICGIFGGFWAKNAIFGHFLSMGFGAFLNIRWLFSGFGRSAGLGFVTTSETGRTGASGVDGLFMYEAADDAIALIEFGFDDVEVVEVIGFVSSKDGIGDVVSELDVASGAGVDEEGDFTDGGHITAPAVAFATDLGCEILEARFVR